MAKKFTAKQISLLTVLGKNTPEDRQVAYENFLSLRRDGIIKATTFLDHLKQRYRFRCEQEWKQRVYLGD